MFEKIGEHTGKYVDPYDGGAFGSEEELAALETAFTEAVALILAQPEKVRVKTGTLLTDPPRDVFETADRSALHRLGTGILAFVERAKREGMYVYFYGD